MWRGRDQLGLHKTLSQKKKKKKEEKRKEKKSKKAMVSLGDPTAR
jgi:hypothetical protein